MKYFLGLNKTTTENIHDNIAHIPNIEDKNIKFSDIKNIQIFTTFLYAQYIKKKPVAIRNDGFVGNRLATPGLRYFYRDKNIAFSWDYIDSVNTYIASKYVLKDPFRITRFSLYTVFFIKLIYKHIDLYSGEGRELIHVDNGIFGIYDSYTPSINHCLHSLYFSSNIKINSLHMFRVINWCH